MARHDEAEEDTAEEQPVQRLQFIITSLSHLSYYGFIRYSITFNLIVFESNV